MSIRGPRLAGAADQAAGAGAGRLVVLGDDDAVDDRRQITPGALVQPPTAAGVLDIAYTPQALEARKRAIVEQSIEIIRKRIDATGTKEPSILREGDDRILVQLPGVGDPERAIAAALQALETTDPEDDTCLVAVRVL